MGTLVRGDLARCKDGLGTRVAMGLFHKFRLKSRSLFSRQQVERELDEELQYHLVRQTEENLAAGMTPEEARYDALRSVRNMEQRKEECRDMRGLMALENIGQDLRYGWRQLRKASVFTLTAVVSLGLGIGASVTMFSAFRAVFLRSLPYRDADRIVEIEKTAQHGYTPALTVADLEFLRRYAHVQSTASFGFFKTVALSRVSEPADLWVRDVSAELFPLLGAKPLLGRTLLPSDFRPNAPLAVVLAYDAWNKYFHRDPGILRHSIFLNENSYLVVGVMPRGFSFPKVGTAAWLPDRTPVVDPMQMYVAVVARLRTGVSLSEARREMKHLAPALLRRYPPSERNWTLDVEDVATRDAESYHTAFVLLLGAVGFLLLIACLNVASLLLARASARGSEFAMRSALGAHRARLIGQVLTESLLLASLSGALGVCLAYCGNHLLLRFLPSGIRVPRLGETHLDLAVWGFAFLLTFLVAVLFGLAPAFVLSGSKLTRPDRQSRATAANSWRNDALLIGEIAISLILLAGSVLMVRGFVRLANVDPGFRTAHILTAMVPPGHAVRLTREQLTQRYSEILRVAQNIPGVEQAALTSYLPLGTIHVELQIYLPGVSPNPYQIDFHAVSADYFAVMGIPLLQGRVFSKLNPGMNKGAVVINRAMAHKYWPGKDAIGQRLGGRPASPPDMTVVGVVGNTQPRSLSWNPIPEFYEDYQQYLGPAVGTTLVLRTFGDPGSAASSLRQALHRFDPEQVVENERTMEATVEQSIATPRFYTVLLGIFALIALVLTLIGIYGVASYGTSLRRREFAIRMALGAERHNLVSMILGQGLLRVLVGVCAGGFGAWAFAHLMAGLVYGIPVKDPVSFGIAVIVLITGALLAYYLPARRSTKVDPAQVLRQE